ncbi:MAG: hypothetical protein QG594_2315, partial [Bacteroidota bacterium]|nr:hypothetical protein [Bacteroidota bacterium]
FTNQGEIEAIFFSDFAKGGGV